MSGKTKKQVKRKSDKAETDTSLEGTKNTSSRSNGYTKPRRSSVNIKDRIWEKEQLQDINLRFDYVLKNFKNKGTGITQETIDEINRQHDKDMEKLIREHESEIAVKNGIISELREENNDLKAFKNKANSDIANKDKEIKRYRNENEELRRENLRLKKELDEASLNFKTQKAKYNKNLVRKENDINSLQRQLDNYEPEPCNHRDEFKQELDRKNREWQHILDKATNELQMTIEELNKEHSKQVAKLQDQIRELKRRVNGLENANEQLKKANKGLRAEIETEKSNNADLLKQIKKLNKQLDDLISKHKLAIENIIDEEKKKFELKDEEYQSLHDSYNRLSQDYFFQLDIKVQLEREIKELQDKLDKFERKYGIQTPFSKYGKIESKLGKRKKSPSGSSIETDNKKLRYDEHHDPGVVLKTILDDNIDVDNFPLHVTSMEFNGDWKGFDVSNRFGKAIIPKGWSFSNPKGDKKCKIISQRYCTKDIIRVVLKGKIDPKWGQDKTKHITPIKWDFDLDNHKGDLVLCIRDSKGNSKVLTTVKKEHRRSTPQNCFVM